MRRLAPGKVGYVGDSSNRFNIGGVGDRYRTRRSDRLRTAGDRHAVHAPRKPTSRAPAALPDMPAPAPVVAPPTGRRPRGANENAPLPKLGPLIQSFGSLLKPLTQAQKQAQLRRR